MCVCVCVCLCVSVCICVCFCLCVFLSLCVCVSLCVLYIFSILSFVDGLFTCFYTLAIVNNAAMNVGVHIYFGITVFIFFAYILRNGIAGSHGKFMFNSLRNYQIVFWSRITAILHSHWQCMRVPVSPQAHQYLILSLVFCSQSAIWVCSDISCGFILHFPND